MIYDIIVIGAGPAGLTAGANAANRGLSTLILEGQAVPGGQPNNFFPNKLIIDYPGFPKGITGKELSKRLYEQALHSKAEIKFNEPMIDLDLDSEIKKIITKKNTYEGKRVIVCTGLHNIPRHLESLKDYKGKNLHYFVKEPKFFANKKLLVVGGGDTAFDRANMLIKYTKKITVLVKAPDHNAQQVSVDTAIKNGVKVLYGSELMKINKKDKVVIIQNNQTKEKYDLKIDEIIVSVGFISSLDVLKKTNLKRCDNGTLWVDENMETSIPGVFAAGDLTGEIKLIAIACTEGIIAAVNTFNSIKSPYWLNK